MKQKLLRLFITMLVALVSTASYANDVCINGIYYEFSNTNATVTDNFDTKYSGDIVVPTTVKYNGTTYRVTTIGFGAFYNCPNLTSIVIPNSVTNIESMAFTGCSSLTNINIPSSVISIGDFAFNKCSNLTSIDIPASVTSIGKSAFYLCPKLEKATFASLPKTDGGPIFPYDTRIYVPKSIYNRAVVMFGNNEVIAYVQNYTITATSADNSMGSVIGAGEYEDDTEVTLTAIPAENYEFVQWSDGTTANPYTFIATANKNVTAQFRAKYYTISATSSDETTGSVTGAGQYLYGETVTLKAVAQNGYKFAKWSDGTNVNPYVFTATENKTISAIFSNKYIRVSFADGTAKYYIFENGILPAVTNENIKKNGVSVEIGEGITTLSDYALKDCSSLTSITIPSSITSIGSYAFQNCSNLTKVQFTSIESLCRIEFGNYCSNPLFYARHLYINDVEMKEVVIPSSVTSIGNFAFRNCSGLTSVTIPTSVNSIGLCAFQDCSSLTSINIPSSVTSIGKYAFEECSKLTKVTIPGSVTSVNEGVFSDCSSLSSIVFQEGVESFDITAFASCPLTSIVIPSSITSVKNSWDGWEDFEFKAPPVSVYITDLRKWLQIADLTNFTASLLAYKEYLPSLYINGESAENIIIPNGTTSIPACAFYNFKNIKSISVPSSVTSVGGSAFGRCSVLESMTLATLPSGIAEAEIPREVKIFVHNDIYTAAVAAFPNNQVVNLDVCTISATSSDETMGSVTGAGEYLKGENVTLTAIPAEGYDFVMWSDGTVDNPYRFTATEDKSVTAQFQECGLHDWTSTNKADNSVSSHTYKINHSSGQRLSFDWSVSSESNYDWLKVSLDGTEVFKKSGSASGTYSQPYATSGTAVLVVSYSKDSSQSRGSDEGKIYNLSLADYYLNITATSADSNQGIVTGGGSMMYGTEVSLTAIPFEGYEFEGWSDGTFQNPYVFTVSGEKNVTAYFHPLSFAISASSADEYMGYVEGTGEYEFGRRITLTAIPFEGYEFEGWSDGTFENPYVFNVNGAKSVTAYFYPLSYTITASSADEYMGYVEGTGEYEFGRRITLTAIPFEGYGFEGWSDGTFENPYVFTVSGEKNVTAYFHPLSYAISASSADEYMGNVEGTGEYEYGSRITLTAIPFEGYEFEGWSDGTFENPYVFTVSGEKELTAYFHPLSYAISASSADEYMGHVEGTGRYEYGSRITLIAIPFEGYQFVHWSDGMSDNPYIFTVSGEKEVLAYFKALPFPITASSSDENMGSVTGTGVYEYGTEVSLTAVPAEGYEFVQWSDGTTENPYIFTVSGEKELTAFFHPLSYVISASSSDENMGSVTGTGEYEYGSNVTLNAEPAEGYEFVQWSDGTTENPYTFTATENKTLTATFQEVVEEEPNEPDTDIALYDNIIYVAPQEVRASMQSEIKIALKNSVPATGFQFEVELPEGMTVAQDSYGEDLVTLNEDRTTSKRHDIFKVTRLNSGHVQVICSSMDNKTFAAGSGNVVNMKLEVNDGVEEGDYPIIIHNIAISDADSHVERVAKAQYSVHVSTCEPGDSNGDGYVDVGDITAIVKYIQQTPPANFLFAAADANNDGFVDVGDITSVVKIIIEQANTSASSRKALIQKVLSEITDYANVIYAEPVTVNSGSESTVSLNMNNDVDVAGFQFEIKLPDGFAIAQDNYGDYQVNLSEMRTTSKRHDLFKVTKLNNGNIQIICNSMSGASFVGNEGEVVTFKLLADESIEPGEYEITLVDVRISDTDSHVDRIGNISTPLTVLGRTPEYAEGYQLEIIPFEAEIGQEYDADADEGNFFVNVKLANAEDVETLEFDVVLPEGFGIGSYLFNAGTQKKPVWVEVYDPYYAGTYTSDDYFPAAEDNEDGTIHVSSEDVVLRASSLTDIISLPITLSDDVIAGLYTIELKNVTANGDVKIAPYRLSVLVGTPALSGNQILYGNYAEDATVLNSVAAMQTVTSIDLTEAVAIAADATITTGNANALIYLAEGMEIANTENVVISDECENLVLTDGNPFFAPKSFYAQLLSYRREGVNANGWYSCVVPFDAEVPAGAKVEEFGSFNGSSISLLPIESISANVPFFFKPSESAFVLTANNTRIEATTSGVFEVGNYMASYEKTAEESITGKYALKADGSGFAVCGEGAYLTPFRAVLSIDNASNARVINVDHSELTGIENVADTTRSTEIFDIQGRRVSNATKAGIYVTNGQKYIMK